MDANQKAGSKVAELDLRLGLAPSHSLLTPFSHDYKNGNEVVKKESLVFQLLASPTSSKMHHNPGKCTQQMVDSGINLGLPEFLYHINLALLPHYHLTHRLADEDPNSESPVPDQGHRSRTRAPGDQRPCPFVVIWRASYLPSKGVSWFSISRLAPKGCLSVPRLGMTDVLPSN